MGALKKCFILLSATSRPAKEVGFEPGHDAPCLFDFIIVLFLLQEQLLGKHLFVDGSKIEETSFTYDMPKINKHLLREVLYTCQYLS